MQRAGAALLSLVLLLGLGLGNALTSGPTVPASPAGGTTAGALRRPAAPPAPAFAPAALEAATGVLRSETERGAFPGAALAVGVRDRTALEAGVGHVGWTPAAPPVSPGGTLYDLASLTKVVATTPAVMLLLEDGKLRLDDPVQKHLSGFEGRGKERVTIRHLLAHTSGLPPGTVLRGSTPREVARRLLRTRIYHEPGSKTEYSDLGFVVLWETAQSALGEESLPAYLRRRLYAPLGMEYTRFQPGLDCEACAPTGRLRDQSLYRGKPFDDTARELGGVTGSAGLFSTAHDLGRFAAMIANGGALEGVRIFLPETVRLFTRPQPGAGTRALGWDYFCPEPPASASESCPDPIAFGHTGWTGTSLWIDPHRGTWTVLLANRTYEPRAPNRINEVRREVWNRVAAGLPPSATTLPQSTPTPAVETP